ncbi:MAG: hypothetical protein ACRDRA_11005 [Pseudonocardiaceae bacterium]
MFHSVRESHHAHAQRADLETRGCRVVIQPNPLESFLADVTEILREEVDGLVRPGCEYIQLDAPHYPLLIDSAYRDVYASRGWPAQRWLDLGLERLALSPQCGFATSILGNALTAADEKAKLRTIVATAERVWG